MSKRHVIAISAACAGGVFLISGIAKLIRPIPAALYFSPLLGVSIGIAERLVLSFASCEVWIAAGILFLPWRALASMSGLVCSILFLGFGLLRINDSADCGCFGGFVHIDAHLHIGLSLALFASTSFLLKKHTWNQVPCHQ
jgi:hypothetical protein